MDKKEKRKVITDIIVIAIFVLLCGLSAGYFVYVAGNGADLGKAFSMSSGGMFYTFFQALGFQVQTIGQDVAVAAGVFAYLGFLASIFAFVMAITKKCIRHISNPIIVLLSFLIASIALGGVFVCQDAGYGQIRYFLLTAVVVFSVIALLAFILSMMFPLQKPQPSAVSSQGGLIEEEEPETPAQENEEAPAPTPEETQLSEPEEKPAEPSPKPKKPVKKPIKPAPQEESKPEPKPVEETPVSDEKPAEPTPKPKKPAKKGVKPETNETPAPTNEPTPKVMGKYEVYLEAGFYKYRLKANNGEILIVSPGYRSKSSAITGIETLKRNIPNASTRIVVDKNGYAQFRISSSNDSRVIATGEIYPNANGAQNALASVMKFYPTDKVVVLEKLPENEIREWEVDLPEVEASANGKIEISQEEGKFIGTLYANNGEILFVTSTYASRSSLLNAIENLREKVSTCRTTIARDKQNRYQFRLFSDNGMLLVVGQSYPSKDAALSSAISMRKFLPLAKISN